MSDVPLTLGGRWLHDVREREQQAATIAHLTNELQGLQLAYQHDLERVAAHQQAYKSLEAELEQTMSERDQWHAAYSQVMQARAEREQLVEAMQTQMQTLESTTRAEELNASAAAKASALLQKEKELLTKKLNDARTELEELYQKLAVTTDQLTTQNDTNASLSASLHAMTRSRDTKETQVIALLKEKQRLFRIVTDLRSTIKVAGGSVRSHDDSSFSNLAATSGKLGALSLHDLEDVVSSEVSSAQNSSRRSTSRGRPSHINGVTNLIQHTLDGTIDRPKWASAQSPPASARRSMRSSRGDLSTAGELDALATKGAIANLSFNAAASAPASARRAASAQRHSAASSVTASAVATPRTNALTPRRNVRPPSASSSAHDASSSLAHSHRSDTSAAAPAPAPVSEAVARAAAAIPSDDDDDETTAAPSTTESRPVAAANKNLILRLKRQVRGAGGGRT